MKVKLLIAIVALATAIVPVTGSANAEPPLVIHFKGRAAQAILTDCLLTYADGTHCSAVEIFISDERYQERGSPTPLSFVDVIVFDVVIDSAVPLGFTPTPVAVGFSTDAEVSVARNLSSASAHATEIDLIGCVIDADGELICEEDGGSMSLHVEWAATGKRQTSTFHERGVDFPFTYNFHAMDASRPATASGEVDGQPLFETPLFASSIFTTNNGLTERISG